MIPESGPPRGRPGARAERAIFDALQEQLSDEWWVYHSLEYLEGRSAREGEIDFLLVHRERGMLLVECKGYGVRRDQDGTWVRRKPDGTEAPLKRDPMSQVREHMHDLRKLLGERRQRLLAGENARGFVWGHAVAFPLSRPEQLNLPVGWSRELVATTSDVAGLGAWAERALSFWKAQRSIEPLTEGSFRRFRDVVLHPTVRIVPTLGAVFELERHRFLRATEQQVQVLESFLRHDRVLITGGAGTGKTVLALEAARHHAAKGRRVLLTCFTRRLGEHLALAKETWGAEGKKVRATHFHSLCATAFAALGQSPEYPNGRDRAASTEFWEHTAPMALFMAVETGEMKRWDAIVVDEGQDFASSWWEVLESCLVVPEKGPLVVFRDEEQDLFGRGAEPPPVEIRHGLTYNFRNTRRIGAVVRELGRVVMHPHPECPHGEDPTVVVYGTRKSALKILDRTVKALCADGIKPSEIVILTPHSRKNSLLANRTEVGGVPLADEPADREGRVLHMTISGFKGLEADVVVLADIDPEDERCSRRARYVAASRARLRLHVLAKGDWTR